MFRLNTSAAEIALGYLEFLCRPLPTKTKRGLGDAVKIAMKAGLSHKAAEQKLQSLGYKVKKSGGLFGVGAHTQIDTSDPGDV